MTETVILKSSLEGEIPKFEYTLDCHLTKIQQSLHFQWLQGAFCDLNLQTNDGCIQVHACLLAAFSPKIAATLNNSFRGLNFRQSNMDIMFQYKTVNAIVEALYSGFFTAAIENIDELLAALQWLEIAELMEVVRCVKAKAEKENLLTQDIKPLQTISHQIEESKSVHKTRKPKPFSKQDAALFGPNSVNVVVSLVNDVPMVVSLNNNGKQSSSPEVTANQEELVKKDKNKSSTDLCPEEVILETTHNEADNDTENNEHQSNLQPNNLDSGKTSYSNSSEKDLQISTGNESMENTEGFKVRKSGRNRKKKSDESEKSITKSDKSLQPSKKEERTEKLKKTKSKKGKSKRQYSLRGKRRKYESKPASPGLTTIASTTGVVPSVPEDEEAKKRQASEALVSMGDHIVKEELPEIEQYDLEGLEEAEKAFLKGETELVKCSKCSVSFSNINDYQNHVQNHPTFTCENCYTVYYSSKSLCRHIRGMHLKPMHLKCTQCDFVATDDKEFGQHCVETHQEFKPFKCLFEGCKFTTTKYRYLTRHFENHENIKQHVCEKCQKSFPNSLRLYSHVRSCYNCQKYLCDICGQSFNHPTSMRIHRTTMHLGQRPHKCQVCTKSFSNGANLRRHMRIHNNSFPYSCHVCSKQFRHSNTLKLHESKHKEVIETTQVVITNDLDALFPPDLSHSHPGNSSLPSNSSIQLCSAASLTSSNASSLSTVPQTMTVATLALTSSTTSNSIPAAASACESSTVFLQYDGEIQWHESENYHLPNL